MTEPDAITRFQSVHRVDWQEFLKKPIGQQLIAALFAAHPTTAPDPGNADVYAYRLGAIDHHRTIIALLAHTLATQPADREEVPQNYPIDPLEPDSKTTT